jgi:hypothetical protein
MKKKFICLKPKTEQAKHFFNHYMLGLQSCEVLEKTSQSYRLKPIRASFTFELPSSGENEDWVIEA